MINIIQTGSKGNAIIVNSAILIDCGVAFSKLKPYYKDLQLVLCTHEHGDHFKKSTIKKLAAERPTLRFGCCEWLVSELIECGVSEKMIDIYSFDLSNDYGDFQIETFQLVHDVPNCGYKIHINQVELTKESECGYAVVADDWKCIYATDTNVINTDANDYDVYMIEANYEDEEIQERIDTKIKEGVEYIYEYGVLKNHLSKQKADEFILKNIGNNGAYIYMHEHHEPT